MVIWSCSDRRRSCNEDCFGAAATGLTGRAATQFGAAAVEERTAVSWFEAAIVVWFCRMCFRPKVENIFVWRIGFDSNGVLSRSAAMKFELQRFESEVSCLIRRCVVIWFGTAS